MVVCTASVKRENGNKVELVLLMEVKSLCLAVVIRPFYASEPQSTSLKHVGQSQRAEGVNHFQTRKGEGDVITHIVFSGTKIANCLRGTVAKLPCLVSHSFSFPSVICVFYISLCSKMIRLHVVCSCNNHKLKTSLNY